MQLNGNFYSAVHAPGDNHFFISHTPNNFVLTISPPSPSPNVAFGEKLRNRWNCFLFVALSMKWLKIGDPLIPEDGDTVLTLCGGVPVALRNIALIASFLLIMGSAWITVSFPLIILGFLVCSARCCCSAICSFGMDSFNVLRAFSFNLLVLLFTIPPLPLDLPLPPIIVCFSGMVVSPISIVDKRLVVMATGVCSKG